MADEERALLDEILSGSETMAKLAESEESFRAAVDAFRAQDGESMHELLEKHELLDRLEIVCGWLRSKETVVLCAELAGDPPADGDGPDIRELAEIAVKLTSDDKLVQLMVDAVQDRDVAAWAQVIDDNGLQTYSHALCHWVCTVQHRLVGDVVRQPIAVQRPHLIPELRSAAEGLRSLLASEAYEEAVKAVLAGSCKDLGALIERVELGKYGFLICEWFCSWRCWYGWLHWARIFPMAPLDSAIDEMFEYARAGARLAHDEATLERLVAAIARDDVKLVTRIIEELKFGRYCVQLCHWVCVLRCRWFCICVIPPRSIGVFTKIGAIYYGSDVNSHQPGNGRTVADNRAFYSTLRLNGGLSLVDGAPLIEYRFQTQKTTANGTPLSASWDDVTPAMIAPTNIGSLIRPIAVWPFIEVIPVWVNYFDSQVVGIAPDADGWIRVPAMLPGPPMVSGPDWRFVPGSDLINLRTTLLKPFTASVDETGVDAGEAPNTPLDTEVHYGIRMRIRDQGDSGDGSEAGTCGHIAINNTHYDNIVHHAYWPGGLFGASDEMAMSSLGIAELATTPCSLLTKALTVKYTAAHTNLGDVSVTMEGPGGLRHFDLVPDGPQAAGELHGTAVPQGWKFSALPKCAYLLKLSVSMLLTTGDATPAPVIDYIAFCKG